MRGKLVILTIVGVAAAAGGLAWWSHYQRGRRALEAWGAEAAYAVRHASHVELLKLTPGESSGGEETSLTIDGRMYRVVEQKNITDARGLVHARHALIQDASFRWDPPTDEPSAEWEYALQFFRSANVESGEQSADATLLFDFQHERVRRLEGSQELRLAPQLMRLEAFFEEQLNGSRRR